MFNTVFPASASPNSARSTHPVDPGRTAGTPLTSRRVSAVGTPSYRAYAQKAPCAWPLLVLSEDAYSCVLLSGMIHKSIALPEYGLHSTSRSFARVIPT